ncbi:hypothetical protein OKA05_06160 [Luteolibacter arcticus]|uniref:DUF2336 domain-containing protein n=1 Tax=Luteolibacter arcticus TaxID=1581411 RepID=A0ABT3GFU6_9BACT|nr:hypothetical protein [Luteolibacter arcticus]MCW1922128.1 hypothetical protein [Luteolibacter arcticus]
MSVPTEDRRQAVNRRARELVDQAILTESPRPRVATKAKPRSPRSAAEEALANRAGILAEWQGKVDAFLKAAAIHQADGQLLEKIEDKLFRNDEEDLSAMVLGLFLQNEDRALAEVCQREALHGTDAIEDALEALSGSTLERWAADPQVPLTIRVQMLASLGQRMGRNGDLEGLLRTWTNSPKAFDSYHHGSLVREFLGEWICTDPGEVVRRIFQDWPEDLRLEFLEQTSEHPIWTDALASAMREAPWERVPEDLKKETMEAIDTSDDPYQELPAQMGRAPDKSLPEGLEPRDARRALTSHMERLLDRGPDMMEQLADGRIAVDEVARDLASRLPGSEHYPELFAEAVFEEAVSTDPAGALKYAEGKISPERLEQLGQEALQSMFYNEPCLERIFEAAALLPANTSEPGSLTGDFMSWQAWAPDQAAAALDKLPARHPLRRRIEEALAGKEEP